MKVTWEADDVRPGRKVVYKGTIKHYKPVVIAWMHGGDGDSRHTWFLCEYERDGMLMHKASSKEEMASHLNDGAYLPLEICS